MDSQSDMLYLIEAVEKKKDLFSGKLGDSISDNRKKKMLWTEVANEMQAIGLTQFGKDGKSVSKRFSNLKYRTKQKAGKIRKSQYATGGGRDDSVPLNPTEEKLLAMMGFTCVDGIWGEAEFDSAVPRMEESTCESIGSTQVPPPSQEVSLVQAARDLDHFVPSSQVLCDDIDDPLEILESIYEQPLPVGKSSTPSNSKSLKSLSRILSASTQPSTHRENASVQPPTSEGNTQTPYFQPFKRRRRETPRNNLDEAMDLEKERIKLKRERFELEKRKLECFETIASELRLLNDKVDMLLENSDK